MTLHLFHYFGYFTRKSDYERHPTVWRQCYSCCKSQWWNWKDGEWSKLEKRDLPYG